MSKAQELQVLDNDIVVPGCKFSRVGLRLEHLDEATLLHAGAFLQQVEGCRAWWWGDFLLALCRFRLSQEDGSLRDEAKRDPKLEHRLFRRYTSEHGEVARVDVDVMHDWRNISAFYDLPRRRGELSNTHHLEAMQAAEGDNTIADDWLDKAINNRWTVPQMRAAIRRAKQQGAEPYEPMPEVHQQELFACARWSKAVAKRVPDMGISEAEQLLRDLQPIVLLAQQLAGRIAAGEKSLQNLRANVRVKKVKDKESIEAAA